MMRTWVGGSILDQFKFIAITERNIPSERNSKAPVLHRACAVVPSKKHFDSYISAA
jgi:hypothetical protein